VSVAVWDSLPQRTLIVTHIILMSQTLYSLMLSTLAA